MTSQEILRLFRPEHLLYFEKPVRTSDGRILIPVGLHGCKLYHLDSWGAEIAVFSGPLAVKAIGTLTFEDLVQAEARPATADEERSWLTRAEAEEGVTA